jgi:hypothetical protein
MPQVYSCTCQEGVEGGQHVDADSSHHMFIPILHHRAALQVIDM